MSRIRQEQPTALIVVRRLAVSSKGITAHPIRVDRQQAIRDRLFLPGPGVTDHLALRLELR
jgi:hypothetical protein